MFRKIVERERGGFCYELNVLFAAALRQIGFDVEMFSARVFDADGKLGREFGHLLVFVQLEDRWIADVGFGDWFAGMCEDLQFGTDSYFRNHRICTRPTAEGRVSVMDDTLIVTKRGARIERPLSGPKELAEVLEEHFGIMLPITSP
jgi:arylamine N-acetyltransferase